MSIWPLTYKTKCYHSHKSFTYKMAAKINWHRYGTIITSLSPYVYIGWSDVTGYMVTIRSPFCGYEMLQCVEIRDEDLSCCSVSLLKVSICQYMSTNKAYLIDITLANISQSFTYKMAPKTSWQRYETKLSHCHPMYNISLSARKRNSRS